MKIFNFYDYDNKIDYTWYNSSNVLYSKCIDNVDALKTLIVVFNNGATYQYEDIPVQEYLAFREHESQGKSLNEIVKKGGYSYTKLDSSNVEVLKEEYERRSNKNYFYSNDNEFKILDYQNRTMFKNEETLNERELKLIESVLTSFGITIKEYNFEKDE